MTREARLTCANNFPPQNNQGPNELSAQPVKRERMPLTLSHAGVCVCVCATTAHIDSETHL